MPAPSGEHATRPHTTSATPQEAGMVLNQATRRVGSVDQSRGVVTFVKSR